MLIFISFILIAVYENRLETASFYIIIKQKIHRGHLNEKAKNEKDKVKNAKGKETKAKTARNETTQFETIRFQEDVYRICIRPINYGNFRLRRDQFNE